MTRGPLRVAFLTTGLAYAGAETQLVRLVTELHRRGWDARIISMLSLGGYAEEIAAAGIPLASLDMTRGVMDPRAPIRLVRLLRQWRPDILTTFMFHANLLGRVVSPLAGVGAVVSSVRSANFGGPSRYRLLAATDRLADVTTANSRAVADDLVRRRIVAAERMQVIPNGIDLPDPVPPAEMNQARKELGVPDNEFLWMAVGRLDPSKDYPKLLEAFRGLSEAGAPVHLRVIGGGPEEARLREMASRLGLDDRVAFLGFRRDVPRLLSSADAYVICSRFEGLPNTLMEAHAMGLPAVGTRVGGVPELILDGVSGHIVPPQDPDALGEAMRKVMRLPVDVRRSMGEAGRNHVRAHFDLQQVVDRWAALFEEFASPRPVPVAWRQEAGSA